MSVYLTFNHQKLNSQSSENQETVTKTLVKSILLIVNDSIIQNRNFYKN